MPSAFLRRFRLGSSVQAAQTNRARVLRRLGVSRSDQGVGAIRLGAAVPFALRGGPSRWPGLVPDVHGDGRNDTRARPANSERLHFPLIISRPWSGLSRRSFSIALTWVLGG